MTKIKSKGYSYELAQAVFNGDQTLPWIELGSICIRQNVPVSELSKVLGVSRQTIYSWFFGKSSPAPNRIAKINEVIAEYHRAKL